MHIEPLAIIEKFYPSGSTGYHFLQNHSRMVAEKALAIARRLTYSRRLPQLEADLDFIREAAMLHDIGIFCTHAPEIGCHGSKPYVCHGYLGRELLEREGFPRHALVCERHVGVGISLRDIEEQSLPVPRRNMQPVTMEEQIICFADKFFSKGRRILCRECSVETIRKRVDKYGPGKLDIFEAWLEMFGS